MEFTASTSFDSASEEKFWEALKVALEDEPGHCWLHFPVTDRRRQTREQKTPDIVLIHPKYGLHVIEVKGCKLDQIDSIIAGTWQMRKGYPQTPITPCQDAYWAVCRISDSLKKFRNGRLQENSKWGCRVHGTYWVAIPEIAEIEWTSRFGQTISTPQPNVLFFASDLDRQSLRRKFEAFSYYQNPPLSDEEIEAALVVLAGVENNRVPFQARSSKRPNSKAAILSKVYEEISRFDLEQHNAAIQIPEGPQQIRGLAGTGKTIVLAQKAALMHCKNPDWEILFTFYTRSLYEQIKEHITRFVKHHSNGELNEPNWNKLRVWHAWGEKYGKTGLYVEISKKANRKSLSLESAKNQFRTRISHRAFDGCCQELLNDDIPEIFDVILIDEAQDFGNNFFKLCHKVLKKPKRIIWGYDELQSLEDLKIPTPEERFGKTNEGQAVVNLDGEYPGGIQKNIVLYRCYRNPRPILIAAHAFGLGLLREKGAVQFIDSVDIWRNLGYQIEGIENNNMKAGQQIKLSRSSTNSPHILEKLAGYKTLVQCQPAFQSRQQEVDWIAEDITRNIQEEELRAEDIMILTLDNLQFESGKYSELYWNSYKMLCAALQKKGIAYLDHRARDIVRREGSVSIPSIFRAKGNEAFLVYIYGFEYAEGDRDIVKRRNTAFTAMTRTKGWLVLTGVGETANKLFKEINSTLEYDGYITCKTPDMAKIQRRLEDYRNQLKQDDKRKAEIVLKKLLNSMVDLEIEDLSPELVERAKDLFKKS